MHKHETAIFQIPRLNTMRVRVDLLRHFAARTQPHLGKENLAPPDCNGCARFLLRMLRSGCIVFYSFSFLGYLLMNKLCGLALAFAVAAVLTVTVPLEAQIRGKADGPCCGVPP